MGVEILVSTSDDVGHCKADSAQLESAILNLAINARDAMPDGGTLTIKSENVLLENVSADWGDVTPGQYIMIAVSDTGTGIPAEIIDNVFEPFFTTKDTGKGSGLGLSMVYGFVKQSGGHVRIDSEEGVGTTVRMYLPKSEAVTGDTMLEDIGAEPRALGETIILVEDDLEVRTLAAALLRDLGYHILEAQDGISALEALNGAPKVDLLLTDVVLPGGISGPDLAEQAGHHRPGISVLFMSGYSNEAITRHGRSELNVALLNKPFRKIDIAQKVRSVLDKANA